MLAAEPPIGWMRTFAPGTAFSCGSRMRPPTPVSAKAQSAVKADTTAASRLVPVLQRRSKNIKFVTLACRATNIKIVLRTASPFPSGARHDAHNTGARPLKLVGVYVVE